MATSLTLSATYYPPRKEGRAGTVGFYVEDKTTRQSYFGAPNMCVDEFAILFPTVNLTQLVEKGSIVLPIKEFQITV